MQSIITVGEHGETLREHHFAGADEHRDAALTYIGIVLNEPATHVKWVTTGTLPGVPEEIIAERFGNPCERPCCVPLAQPWPEDAAPSHRVKVERERTEP